MVGNDIVERLRSAVTASNGVDLRDGHLLIEAADLIHRMRIDHRSVRIALSVEQKRHAKLRREMHELSRRPPIIRDKGGRDG